MFFFTRRVKKNILGLSLAEHVQFHVGRFFVPQGEKTTHNKDKVPCCRRLKLPFG
jgi:hypothetical protein